ncbi:hypothetical protein TNCV_1879991 [Trichonephila clavipes]|nr:hypothetical protein TNCV_1879991 [Trichonephila clavipes]
MEYSVLRGKYQRNLELQKALTLGFGNDSKITEMSVDVTMQIAPELHRRMKTAVTPKRSRRNKVSDMSL